MQENKTQTPNKRKKMLWALIAVQVLLLCVMGYALAVGKTTVVTILAVVVVLVGGVGIPLLNKQASK